MNLQDIFTVNRIRRIGLVMGHLGTFGMVMMRIDGTNEFIGYALGILIVTVGYSLYIFLE